MIDEETAERAVLLLSTVIGELVEDEHVAMIVPPRGRSAAEGHAERLEQLGRDLTTISAAITVVLRRTDSNGSN